MISEAEIPYSQGSGRRPRIVATIPAYNEARNIGRIVLETLKYADVVIVVDDGSDDSTALIAEQAGAKVVRHGRNLGYGAAIKTCLEYGYRENGNVIVTIDGDGQHDPGCIPSLVKQITEGYNDIVIGSRFLTETKTKMSRHREFGVRLITGMLSATTHDKFSDAQSGLRAYSRRALHTLLPVIISDGMGISTEILIRAGEQGLKIEEIPAAISYETGGRTSTKNPFRHGGEVILSMVELVAEKRPLFFIGMPGLICFSIGIVSLLMVFNIFNETRQFATGTAMLSVASTLVGLLMLFGATILYVVKRLRKQLESFIKNSD